MQKAFLSHSTGWNIASDNLRLETLLSFLETLRYLENNVRLPRKKSDASLENSNRKFSTLGEQTFGQIFGL